MKLTSLEAILAALKQHNVRYLIVGGLAVVAHGYGRLTIDVDLVVQLQLSNVTQALEALASLGYRPVAPVSAEQFADPVIREGWIREKNMVVFGLHSPQHPQTPVDIFTSEPFDFDEEDRRALVGEIAPGLAARFVCLETLIKMKAATGRERDQEDVRTLRQLKEQSDGNA
jgi:predicted nucleotidyltransferase